MSLQDIFNSIGQFITTINKSISDAINNIWTANLYNETFLKIVIFIIVYVLSWWLFIVLNENYKKIEEKNSKIKPNEIKKSPASQKAIVVGIIVFSYAVTGLIVMYFGIDEINN